MILYSKSILHTVTDVWKILPLTLYTCNRYIRLVMEYRLRTESNVKMCTTWLSMRVSFSCWKLEHGQHHQDFMENVVFIIWTIIGNFYRIPKGMFMHELHTMNTIYIYIMVYINFKNIGFESTIFVHVKWLGFSEYSPLYSNVYVKSLKLIISVKQRVVRVTIALQ